MLFIFLVIVVSKIYIQSEEILDPILSATGKKPGAKIEKMYQGACWHYITHRILATAGISNVIGVNWRK